MSYEPGRSDQSLEGDDGVDKRLVVRLVVAVAVIVLILLFMTQNNDEVDTSFVFFTVQTRLWVSLLVAVLLGVILGQLGQMVWHRRKARRAGRSDGD
jgi:uncharacterized integral membrane protein